MGKKYMIKVVKDTDEALPELHHGSIVELEELEEKKNYCEKCGGYSPQVKYCSCRKEELDEKKETLEAKFQSIGIAQFTSISAKNIAIKHFQSHHEELGLVRIEDVLKEIDKVTDGRTIYPDNDKTVVLLYKIRKAIEGMKVSQNVRT